MLDSYVFGFNGQERETEVGPGSYSAEYWLYDGRLGMRKERDRIRYPWLSPYATFNNNPIYYADPDGQKGVPTSLLGKATTEIEKQTAKTIVKETAKKGFFSMAGETLLAVGEGALSFVGFMLTPQTAYAPSPMNFAKPYEPTPWQIFTHDPTELDDDYLQVVADRMLNNKAVGNDQRDYQEYVKRDNRKTFALGFYQNSGYDLSEAKEHIEGIDFTEKVYETTIKKGTIVNQWVWEGGKTGNYFSNAENTDKNLGIDYEDNKRGTKRVLKQFEVLEDVKVLTSTASDYKGKKGGGKQYFSTDWKVKEVEKK